MLHRSLHNYKLNFFMSHRKPLALLVLLALTLVACSEHKDPTLPQQKKDPALQAALDELTRLGSFTETGLNYTEYSDRLLTAKGNIDVTLQRTSDEPAKAKIKEAVSCYVDARSEWMKKLDDKNYSGRGVQYFWKKATAATSLAAEYAFADQATRQQIDARELEKAKRQRDEENKAYDERRKAAEAKLKAHQQALVKRYQTIENADEKLNFLKSLAPEDQNAVILAK